MKMLKIMMITLITVFTFGAAKAQIRIKANIGAPSHRVVVVHRRPAYHRRVVVVRHRPIYHRRHVVVVHR